MKKKNSTINSLFLLSSMIFDPKLSGLVLSTTYMCVNVSISLCSTQPKHLWVITVLISSSVFNPVFFPQHIYHNLLNWGRKNTHPTHSNTSDAGNLMPPSGPITGLKILGSSCTFLHSPTRKRVHIQIYYSISFYFGRWWRFPLWRYNMLNKKENFYSVFFFFGLFFVLHKLVLCRCVHCIV